jgi:hypothetical protein
MSYDRLPDQITGPMTTSQVKTLRSLAVEAYQEKLFHPDLSRAEAAKRIDFLDGRSNWPTRSRYLNAAGSNLVAPCASFSLKPPEDDARASQNYPG